MTYVYVAGPLFNTHERWYLEQIASALESKGYTTYLPHRDGGLLDDKSDASRTKIFQADLDALKKCDICVALLTGVDQDSGTSAELGYAYAKGKPCYGITDDMRWLNNVIWGICSNGKHIVKTIDDLLPLLQQK
jgi:nucleoside 2-deoxyribosyltransferase